MTKPLTPTKILRLAQVSVFKQQSEPLMLLIHAVGHAATAGWTNPRLEEIAGSDPADSVLDFAFVADRPMQPVPQLIVPIVASAVISPKGKVDAINVVSRTDSLIVHASDFLSQDIPESTMAGQGQGQGQGVIESLIGYPSTDAVGEEGGWRPPTTLVGERWPTTKMLGEEGGWPPTTKMLGEEGGWPPTTKMLGEEGGWPPTSAFGEHGGGPYVDPRIPDPSRPIITTLALGEESGGGGTIIGPGPFGPF